jgi:hypothetical protein
MSLLVNESYANPTTPLWAGSNGPMYYYPNITLSDSGAIGPGDAFVLGTLPFPSQIAVGDNFIMNLVITIDAIDVTVSGQTVFGNLEFFLQYTDDGPIGSNTVYNNISVYSYTPEGITTTNGRVQLTLLGNNGGFPSDLNIQVTNKASDKIVLSGVNVVLGYYQKIGSVLVPA